jgi:transcriptional regulator with GAF, ATPase, and Fis domain
MVHLPLDGSLSLDEMERRIIEAALIRNNHNVMATARDLGVSRETLRYRVERHGLKKPMNNLQQPQKP